MKMNKTFGLLFLSISFSFFAFHVADAGTLVEGYLRSDGDTFVEGYYRSDPDSDPYNNTGFPGNLNPHTGKITPGNPEAYLTNYYRIKSNNDDKDLYKALHYNGLKESLKLGTTPPDRSKELQNATEDFLKELRQDQRVIEDRLYQLRLQNATGIFAQCIYPNVSGCSEEDSYSRMRALDATTGMLGTDTSNSKLAQCRVQIDAYRQKLNQYDQCTSGIQSQAINNLADKAVEIAKLEGESAYYKSLIAQKQKESADLNASLQTLLQKQTACQNDHGLFSYLNQTSNKCECRNGMGPDANNPYQCIPLLIWCKIEGGIGATNKIDQYIDGVNRNVICMCEDGHEWNSGQTQCVKKFNPESLEVTPVDNTSTRPLNPSSSNPPVAVSSVPVKMTRTQYEAKYGTVPQVARTQEVPAPTLNPSNTKNLGKSSKKTLTLAEVKARMPYAPQQPGSVSTEKAMEKPPLNISSTTKPEIPKNVDVKEKKSLLSRIRNFALTFWK